MANKFLGEAGVKELIDHIPSIGSGSIIDIPNMKKDVLKYSSGLYGNYVLIKDVDISFSGSLNNITAKFTKKKGNIAPLLLNGNGVNYHLAADNDFINGFKNAAEGEMFFEKKYDIQKTILDICVIISNAESYTINGTNASVIGIPEDTVIFVPTQYKYTGVLADSNLPDINELIANVVQSYNGSNISTTISSKFHALSDYLIDNSALHVGSVIYFNGNMYAITALAGTAYNGFIGTPINEISADEVREQFNS